jgi:signal transduction histidine kinase
VASRTEFHDSSPDELERDFRRRVTRNAALATGILALLSVAGRIIMGSMNPVQVALNVAAGLLLLAVPALLRSPRMQTAAAYLLLFCWTSIAMVAGFFNGGLRAPAVGAFVLTPLFGFLCLGEKGGRAGVILSAISLGLLFSCDRYTMPLDSPEHFIHYKTLVLSAAILAAYSLGLVYERIRRSSEERIYQLSSQMLHSAKMVSLGEMAGGIAHEINNPLAVIKVKIGILRKQLESGRPDRATLLSELTQLDATVARIAKAVAGLRAFSAPGIAEHPLPHSISKIILDTLQICGERFRFHGISLEVSHPVDFQVECRPGEIMQILLNLIGNSFDAVEGLAEKWIRVQVVERGADVELSVTDSGPGIDPKIQDHLMQPFFTTKAVGKGTGLGLSISRGLAQGNGGSLAHDPSSSRTRFVLTLPKLVAASSHSRAQANRPAASSRALEESAQSLGTELH